MKIKLEDVMDQLELIADVIRDLYEMDYELTNGAAECLQNYVRSLMETEIDICGGNTK